MNGYSSKKISAVLQNQLARTDSNRPWSVRLVHRATPAAGERTPSGEGAPPGERTPPGNRT